jgi:hypothetical protein
MKLKELIKKEFKTAMVEGDAKKETFKTHAVDGYSFTYQNDIWYIYYTERKWVIVHPGTGCLAFEENTQGGAVLKLIKNYYDNRKSFHDAAIDSAVKELTVAGLYPVNE